MVKGRRRDKGQKVKYSSSAEKNPGICKTRSDTSSNSSKHSENRSQNESKNANKVKTRSSSRGGGSCSGSVEQISGSYKTCGDSSSGDSKQKSIEPTDIAKKAKTRMSTRSGGTTSSSNGGSTSSSSGSSTSSSSSGQLESGGSGDIPGTSKKSQRTKKSNPIGSDLRPNEVESQNTKKVKTRMSSRGADSGSNSGERLSDSYKTCGDSSSDDSKQRVIVATDIGKRAKTPMSSISGGTISSSSSCQLESGGNDNIPGTSRKSQRTKKSNPTGSDLKSSSSKQSPVVPQNVESAQMRSSLRSNDSIPKSHEQIEVVPQIAEAVKTRQRKCNEKKNYFETKTAEKQGRKSYNKKRKELPGKPVRVNEISLKDAVPVVAARKNSRVRRGSGDSELEGDNDANSKGSRIAPFLPKCNLWSWDGKSYHRVSKNGFQKHFYKSIIRGEEKISVGDCAVLLSTGQPDHPYIGRIVSMWELSPGNKKKLRAKWYYHPAEVKGCPKLKWQGALFESSHEDENDVQTISHRCEVISFADYIAKFGDDPRQHQAANDNNDTYYLAGVYKPALKTFTLKNNIPTEVENKTQTN